MEKNENNQIENRNGRSTCNVEDIAQILNNKLINDIKNPNSINSIKSDTPSTSTCNIFIIYKILFLLDKEEIKQKGITEDELCFLIKDNSSGIIYDIRHQNTATMLKDDFEKLTTLPKQENKKAWKDWWKERKEKSYKLLAACENGEIQEVLDLLNSEKHGDLIADINTKGLDDFTPLHHAVSEDYLELVKILISKGANVDSPSITLRTPLHIAACRGDEGVIEVLCKAHASINIQDKDGNTPAHLLSSYGNHSGLKTLLNYNPDLNIKNIYGELAYTLAGSVEIQKLLEIASGNKDDERGYSRTIVDNLIIHNNRADHIKSLMFKTNILSHQSVILSKKELKPMNPDTKNPEPKNHCSKNVNRRIRIIEATTHLKDPLKEDNKGNHCEHESISESKAGPSDFMVLDLLGKGSFGVVYLARHKVTNKLYALKLLPKKRMMTQNLLKYAKAERNVLCYTKHPFIVGLEYAFQTSDNLVLALDFCPGYF